jgi:FAD/FMN-containing dehydrogenase
VTLLHPLDALRATGADLLQPGDPGYDDARRSFNGTIDHRPAALVRCRSVEDVVAAVRAARDSGLSIAVRGGGHGVAGHCVAEGSLVVDLREMRSVSVDPTARVARAGGGCQWEDVDRAAFAHGLAVTGGTFWDTGIGGLTLGGGLGFLMGTAGLTCDNLVGATVVTATGDTVRAGEDGDPELLWALRGGGGNFGVVTEFTYRLHPVGPFTMGRVLVPLEPDGATVLALAAELAASGPDELVMFVIGPSGLDAEGNELEPGSVRYVVRLDLMFQGAAEDLEPLVAPFRALSAATVVLTPGTYLDVQAGPLLPFGLRNYWKGHFVRALDGPTIEAALEAMTTVPGPFSILLMEAITGQARREPQGGAAFGQRAATWNVSALGIWEDPAADDAHIGWVRRFVDRIRPGSLTGAGYGNYSSADESAERIRAAYGDDRFARLQRIKARYDPENVFRFNHNIPPALD